MYSMKDYKMINFDSSIFPKYDQAWGIQVIQHTEMEKQ